MKALRTSPLARLLKSRKASLLSFAVALGALSVSAIWFTSARASLDQGYSLIGDRQQTLAAANHRLQEARLRVQLASGAQELVAEAAAGGFVDQAWGERLINMSQSPMPRGDVNALLAGVTRNDSRIFGAEQFELSVTRADEGLFDTPDPRSPPLMLTLRGTLLFRTQDLRGGALPAAAAVLPPVPGADGFDVAATTFPEAP
jgi:hypothetical protein